MNIKEKVANLVKDYGTNNVYDLIERLDISLVFTNLDTSMLGIYRKLKRNKFIFIEDSLDDINKKFILAHELGHAVLHSSVNCFFLENNSFFVKNKIEREANEFSAELLIDDAELKDLLCSSYTTAQIAALMEVPESLILYKLKNLK